MIMKINLPHLSLNEKDLFILFFALFLFFVYFFKISTLPFRFESLIVVMLFLFTTRSLVQQSKFHQYLIIAISGLAFSTVLSPYGLLIFYIITLLLYKKTNLL